MSTTTNVNVNQAECVKGVHYITGTVYYNVCTNTTLTVLPNGSLHYALFAMAGILMATLAVIFWKLIFD